MIMTRGVMRMIHEAMSLLYCYYEAALYGRAYVYVINGMHEDDLCTRSESVHAVDHRCIL